MDALTRNGAACIGISPGQRLNQSELKKLLQEHTDELISESLMRYVMDYMHADGDGRFCGDEMTLFIRRIAAGEQDVLTDHHGFWLGKTGFLRTLGNW